MNDNNQPATRRDVEEIVTKAVTGATSRILTAVGDQFDVVNDCIDELDDRLGSKIDRLEQKVDNVLDDHEVRLTKLERA